MKTVHLLIKGKVQGVFFRASAKDAAKQAGVKGWVKNTKEGHVEAIVTGEEQQVAKFINWCKHGPPAANVTDVTVTEKEYVLFEHFSVVH